jgi:hypothetical protein
MIHQWSFTFEFFQKQVHDMTQSHTRIWEVENISNEAPPVAHKIPGIWGASAE